MLWLALAAQKFGKRPSELAEIPCPNAALDFDLACAYRLEIHETECRKAQAQFIAYEVSKLFGEAEGTQQEEQAAEVW